MNGCLIRVLLVDDEPFIRQGLSILIDWQMLGFEIQGQAADGIQALEMLEKQEYDLVIADIKMPRMDGLTMAEKINSNPECGAKVIILSGHSEFGFAQAAIRNGVVDYILKPLTKKDLVSVLESFKADFILKNQPVPAELPKQAAKPFSADACQPPMAAFPDGVTPSKEILQAVEQYIHEHYSLPLSLKTFGQEHYINSVYLGQLFKKEYGVSFKEYLNEYRMAQAARKLVQTDLRVYEIAQAVGYSKTDYFISRFVQQYGKTPYQYRLRFLQQEK